MESFETERGDVLLSVQLVLASEQDQGSPWDSSGDTPAFGVQVPVLATPIDAAALPGGPRRLQPLSFRKRRVAGPRLVDQATGARTMVALLRDLWPEGGVASLNHDDSAIPGPSGPRTLISVDVQPLASIRARAGYDTADAVLRALVEAVPFALDPTTRVYRVGQDGLALLLPGSEEDLPERARQALEAGAQPVLETRHLPAVSLSLGQMGPLSEERFGVDPAAA